MHKLSLFLTILLISIQGCSKINSHGIEFKNGSVFNGSSFERKTFYVIDRFISFTAPGIIDSVIDLEHKFIIPPYGEAHNHNMDDYITDVKINNYLSRGIFYVKVPNILPRSRENTVSKINIHNSVDAVFANGGLTASGGHPLGLVKRNMARGIFKPEDGEGQFYHTIDDIDELENKWKQIVSGKPDFIKTYLLYSEEYEARKNDTTFFAWKGLSPIVLKAIVTKAHNAGLSVSTHIETAADFKHAVQADVDEINHFPGFRPQVAYMNKLSIYQIQEEDAKIAGEKKITVVTTLAGVLITINSLEEDIKLELKNILATNIALLKKYNVPIAIGSDNYGGTSLDEAIILAKSELFSNLELLKMWTETTVATIYPKKKLGSITDGYLANFLVLQKNPIDHFDNFQSISLMYKEGKLLTNYNLPKPNKN